MVCPQPDSVDPDSYADSEEIAYHVGRGPVKAFLNHLDSSFPGKVRVFAHSMGGIVVSEALRNGAKVHTFAPCQAAMVGHAYDPQLPLRTDFTFETPEVYGHYPLDGMPYFGAIANKIYNFYNQDDAALDGWRTGQAWKPNSGERATDAKMAGAQGYGNQAVGKWAGEGYAIRGFDSSANTGTFVYLGDEGDEPLNFSDHTPEIFSHAAEGRSRAIGTQESVKFKGNFNLQDFSDESQNFTEDPRDHSGQFNLTLPWPIAICSGKYC